MYPRPLLVVLLIVSAVAAPAAAQKYTPRKITFIGAASSPAELLAAAGLKPGDPVDRPAMQAAAQKLIDTGLYSDVRFAFDGVELRYMLKLAGNTEPVSYVNFPWWNNEALTAAVAAKVPLFHGSVPPESGMQHQVVAALTQLVAEKGVRATITAVPATDLATGEAMSVQFHIDAPPVQIGSVTFAGASSAWRDSLTAIQKAAAGQDYDDATEATLATALRAIYHRQGYLDEQMSDFVRGEPQIADGKVMVPVTATITEGPQYRLTALRLSGDVLMSPADFAKVSRLHPGDVVNEDLLRQTLAAVAMPYKSHGYLRANIQSEPALDNAAHTISYTISVQPGPVFHMGQLSLVNLSEEQKAEVLKYWPLHTGDVYDATVAVTFLLNNKRTLHSLDGWSGSWKAYEHEDTHVVDLVVTFHPGGPLE